MKLWIVILFFLSSCARGLVEDPSISVVDANYPSLEIYHRGNLYNGLAIVEAQPTMSVNQMGIAIQGYYKGEIRIFSDQCNVDQISRYGENQRVTLDYNFKIEDFCIFTVILQPDYPKRKAIKIYPLKGHIAIFTSKKTPAENQTAKVSKGNSFSITTTFNSSKAMAYFRGCGVSENRELHFDDGILFFDLNDFNIEQDTCVLQAALIDGDIKKRLRVFIARHDPRFVPLETPIYKIKDDKIKLEGSRVTSLLSVGNEYDLDDKESFKFINLDTVRAATNKGRLVLGVIEWRRVRWIR